jgi:hypothetical protein
MPQVRNEIHQTTTAGFLRESNLWTLIYDTDTGAMNVEHEWSYVDPFGQGGPDSGVTTVPLESFLLGNADDTVKQKLRVILKGSRNA